MINTRFAPSPTGNLHIGGARTAIISWLIAKKLDGGFKLRIEDTDQERSKQEYTDGIIKSLNWLGISYDNTPIYQMQRLDRYKEVAENLVKQGLAYYCYTSMEELNQQREDFKLKFGNDGWKYNRKWRDMTPDAQNTKGVSPVIRLKVPLDGSVQWNDLTKGGISFPNTQLDDFIIMRSDGTPTYNFCVVVDDADMEISHVIRGDDHINNTPKQIHIYNALGKDVPVFGHIPLILDKDGKKQSKRDNSSSLDFYKDVGYLSDAVVNYLLLISCNDVGKEIFTKAEFVDMFNLNKLGNTPIKFDIEKLTWINQQYIKNLPMDDFLVLLKEDAVRNGVDVSTWDNYNFSVLANGIKERSKLTTDFYNLVAPVLNWNTSGFSNPLLVKALDDMLLLSDWSHDVIHDSLKKTAMDSGIKFGELVKTLRGEVFIDSKLPIADMILFLGKEKLKDCQKKQVSNKM